MKRTLVYGAATAAMMLALGSGLNLSRCGNGQVETLYGPPTADKPDPNASDNPEAILYGPPVTSDDPIEDVYGPPVGYDDPDAIQTLYGVPTDWEDEPVANVEGTSADAKKNSDAAK